MPIFEIPPEKYSAYAIMHLLLDPKIDENKLASRRPLECSFSSSFDVDVSKIAKKVCMENGCTLAHTPMFSGALFQMVIMFI